jgi:hypothetical protein
MIELIMEIDAESLQVRKETNDRLTPFGLDFDRPATKTFHKFAQQHDGISHCRIINTVHMMRMFWCNIAMGYLGILLHCPDTKKDLASESAWLELQQALQDTIRSEADLILSTLPYCIPHGTSPLTQISTCPLIWPLVTFGAYQETTELQKSRAKEALFQIGTRAKIRVATKMAEEHFVLDAKLSDEAHMLHHAWHT